MNTKKGRLDVPGFAFGIKTGEYIDVPRIFGGKPQPKKSGKPHSLADLTGTIVSRARKGLILATQVAKQDYHRRKRSRYKEIKKAVTNVTPAIPCNRRFFEHVGMKAGFVPYVEQPEPWAYRSKIAYEITDGLCPMVTVTSAREAIIICVTLARYGIAAYFNQIAIPRF